MLLHLDGRKHVREEVRREEHVRDGPRREWIVFGAARIEDVRRLLGVKLSGQRGKDLLRQAREARGGAG